VRLRQLVGALVGAAALMVMLAAPASAHAILRSTTPADGEALDTAPESVRLEFNEPVSTGAGGIRVFNDQGVRVDAGDAATPTDDLESVEVDLADALSDGTYVVSWRALSADAHPVHGAFVFDVGEASADDAVVSQILKGSSDTALQSAATVLRFLQYAAALIAAGGVAFLVWVHDRNSDERARLVRAVVTAAAVVVATTVVAYAVQASLVTGLGVSAAFSTAGVNEVLQSTYGISSMGLLLGAAVVLVGARRLWDGWAVGLAEVGAVLLIASFAVTGHSATSTPRLLVVGADIAHALAGAAWFGGLTLLVLSLRNRRAVDDPVGGGEMVSRFSSMATLSILIVTVAGFALAWAEVRATRALLSTGYGVTLIVKVVLVGAILLIGAYNKRRLVPAIRRAGAEAWGRLRNLVVLEVAGLVLVLAVTAVLVNLIPARDAAGITGPLSVRADLGQDHLVDITVDPNRAGTNEMHIYVFTNDGRAADAESISVGLTMPSNDIGPIEREPTPTGPGHWTLTAADLPLSGRWIVTITAATSRFDEATAEIPIDVGG
jgi:copper transport protein